MTVPKQLTLNLIRYEPLRVHPGALSCKHKDLIIAMQQLARNPKTNLHQNCAPLKQPKDDVLRIGDEKGASVTQHLDRRCYSVATEVIFDSRRNSLRRGESGERLHRNGN